MSNFTKSLGALLAASLVLMSCSSGSTNQSATVSENSQKTPSVLPTAENFRVVIDAGSSGSRVYIYKIMPSDSKLPVITMEYESKHNRPLASFANDPNKAGSDGIEPLLTEAIKHLKSAQPDLDLAKVETSILATAGMRLISQVQQNGIYAAVQKTITSSGLAVKNIKTIEGKEEGLFSWLDINYIKGNFAKPADKPTETNGIIEIGGASMQIAFATENNQQSDSNLISSMVINDHEYSVYANSYLGLGQDQALAAMKKEVTAPNSNQCYPSGYKNDKDGIQGKWNIQQCTKIYSQILNNHADKSLATIINHNGFHTTNFVATSSTYHAINFHKNELNLTGDKTFELKSLNEATKTFKDAINDKCNKEYNLLAEQYPNNKYWHNQCANSVYINELLYEKLKISNKLYVSTEINGRSPTWTLGYVLHNVLQTKNN